MAKLQTQGDDYIVVWTTALTHLRGWQPSEVRSWAVKWEPQLSDRDSVFYHEDPFWYLSSLLVPDDVRSQLRSREYRRLRESVAKLLRTDFPRWKDESFDWERQNAEITAVVNDFMRQRTGGPKVTGSITASAQTDVAAMGDRLRIRYRLRRYPGRGSVIEFPTAGSRPRRASTALVEAVSEVLQNERSPLRVESLYERVQEKMPGNVLLDHVRLALRFLRDAALVRRSDSAKYQKAVSDLPSAARAAVNRLSQQ